MGKWVAQSAKLVITKLVIEIVKSNKDVKAQRGVNPKSGGVDLGSETLPF